MVVCIAPLLLQALLWPPRHQDALTSSAGSAVFWEVKEEEEGLGWCVRAWPRCAVRILWLIGGVFVCVKIKREREWWKGGLNEKVVCFQGECV